MRRRDSRRRRTTIEPGTVANGLASLTSSNATPTNSKNEQGTDSSTAVTSQQPSSSHRKPPIPRQPSSTEDPILNDKVESIRQAHEQRQKQRHSLCIVSSSGDDEDEPPNRNELSTSATTDTVRKNGTQKFRVNSHSGPSKKLTISTIETSDSPPTNESSIEIPSTPPQSQPIPIEYFPGEHISTTNTHTGRFHRSESNPDLGESRQFDSNPMTNRVTNPILAAAAGVHSGIQELMSLDNSTTVRYCTAPPRQDSLGDTPSSPSATSANEAEPGRSTEQRRSRFRRRSSIAPDREISREAGGRLSRSSSFLNTPLIDYGSKYKPKIMFGRRGEAINEMNWPRGIVTLPGGEFAVCDSSNHRILMFDLSGKLLNSFGKYGTEEGELDSCAGIAYNRYKQQLVVSDRYNHRIQIFDLEGNFVRQFGSFGNTNGKFNNPWGVAVDELGLIYVCDKVSLISDLKINNRLKDNHRVQVFDQNGNFMTKFGSNGDGLGQFNHPLFIAIHRRTQNIFVSDSANHRICVFDHDGTPILSFGVEGFHTGQLKLPRGIAIDDQVRKNYHLKIIVLNSGVCHCC